MNQCVSRSLVLIVINGLLTAPAFAQRSRDKVVVALTNNQGVSAGTATIKRSGNLGVVVILNVKNLPPGEHALHFHPNAKCDPPEFISAGPHLNPHNKEHGFLNPQGHHDGDMANFTVNSDGTAKVTIKNADLVLGTGAGDNSLFANGGTALIIDANADDMKSDPSGNSGNGIACGVITK